MNKFFVLLWALKLCWRLLWHSFIRYNVWEEKLLSMATLYDFGVILARMSFDPEWAPHKGVIIFFLYSWFPLLCWQRLIDTFPPFLSWSWLHIFNSPHQCSLAYRADSSWLVKTIWLEVQSCNTTSFKLSAVTSRFLKMLTLVANTLFAYFWFQTEWCGFANSHQIDIFIEL